MKRVGGLSLVLALGMMTAAACDDVSGSGGAAASTSTGTTVGSTSGSTSTSGDSSTSTGAPPTNCIALTDQASCEAAGCIYTDATLYSSMGADPAVCANGSPVSVCTYFVLTPFQSYSTWKRDSAAGRTVLVLGIVDSVDGFEKCAEVSMDPCTCFAPP